MQPDVVHVEQQIIWRLGHFLDLSNKIKIDGDILLK